MINKDYHKTNLHERLLRNILFNVELLRNDKDIEISEYDIQAFMSIFLKKNLMNTKYQTNRECFGKYDCAISLRSKNTPQILYELKTYSKTKEKLDRKDSYFKILKDFNKLKEGIDKFKTSRAYFILVCKKSDIKRVFSNSKFDFINNHINNSKKFKIFSYNGIKIKIRPSRKFAYEDTYVLSWEII